MTGLMDGEFVAFSNAVVVTPSLGLYEGLELRLIAILGASDTIAEGPLLEPIALGPPLGPPLDEGCTLGPSVTRYNPNPHSKFRSPRSKLMQMTVRPVRGSTVLFSTELATGPPPVPNVRWIRFGDGCSRAFLAMVDPPSEAAGVRRRFGGCSAPSSVETRRSRDLRSSSNRLCEDDPDPPPPPPPPSAGYLPPLFASSSPS
mmetsp:Transcript_20532/g.38770  ORF Transcript_20532/g.38770 Transcript_20532/m.38770 type:complete len:202 (+) Transcript_20532:789-1394(+)